jgi:hypothetical protein
MINHKSDPYSDICNDLTLEKFSFLSYARLQLATINQKSCIWIISLIRSALISIVLEYTCNDDENRPSGLIADSHFRFLL